MQLTEDQRRFYDEQGYLLFPSLLRIEEIALLREETERLAALDTDHVLRVDDIATVYRCHEVDGPTASRPFHLAARDSPGPWESRSSSWEIDFYIYNSKINLKKAITGGPMLWHQDYGYWRLDRMPQPRAATIMIALGDVDEIGGGLYVIPGSHKRGTLKHKPQMVGGHKQFCVEREAEIALMADLPTPVALSGRAGLACIFNCNLIHGSGQNLSRFDRWQTYFAYNPADNAPSQLTHDRPEYMKSQNTAAMIPAPDDALLEAELSPA